MVDPQGGANIIQVAAITTPAFEYVSVSGPTSTSQSTDDDEGLQVTGWGEGGPVYLET